MTELHADIAAAAIDLIGQEWDKQGHDMTGAFKQSMYYDVIEESNSFKIRIIDGTERGYGRILDLGVKADQIKSPFAPPRIEGLTNFVKQRGIASDDKQARSIAYAIAYTHKYGGETNPGGGMPTDGSRKFSSTGKRTQFVADVLPEIEKIVSELISKTIQNEYQFR